MKSQWPISPLSPFLTEVSRRNKGDSEYPVYSITNRSGFVLSTEYFNKEVFSSDVSNYKIVQKREFGYNPSRINVGSIDFWDSDEPVLVSPLYVTFGIDQNKLYPLYLLLFLKSDWGRRQIAAKTRNAARNSLVFKDFKTIKIPLPSIPDQIRIATLLSRIEALAAKRRESLRLLDDLVKSRFWKIFGEIILQKESKEPLSQVAKINSGVTKGKNYFGKKTITVPYLRVANVQAGYIDISQLNEIEVLPNDLQKYDLKKGDLLLTEGGDPDKLGRGALWNHDVPNCIFQNHIFRVRIYDNKKVNPTYLSHLTASSFGRQYFLKSAKQTTGIASINSTQLGKFPVAIPKPDLQTQFANFVTQVEYLKSKYTASLATLEQLYASASHRAFRGELDLSAMDMREELLRHEMTAAQTVPSVQELEAVGKVVARLHRQMTDAVQPLLQFVETQSKMEVTLAAFRPALEILQKFQPLQRQSLAHFKAIEPSVKAYQKIQKEWAKSVEQWANQTYTFEEFWEDEVKPENYEARKAEMYNWLREGFLTQEFDTEKRSIVFKMKHSRTQPNE